MPIQSILYLYKGGTCASCGKTLHEMERRFGTSKGQFDFNHTEPAKKAADYRNLIRQKTLTSRQLDEVDKCVLLCKECHTALHGQNIFLDVDVQLEAEGVVIAHRLRCQVIRDSDKGDLLLHDAIPLLHLLRVTSGGHVAIHSCLQLKENGLFDSLLTATRNGNDLRIETLSGFCMYQAQKLNEQEFEFSQSGDFLASPIHVRGLLKGGDQMDAFVRSGQMMILSHIGRGIGRKGGFRIRGTNSYGSQEPAETFEIETPDPEKPRDQPIDFGPSVIITRAEIVVP